MLVKLISHYSQDYSQLKTWEREKMTLADMNVLWVCKQEVPPCYLLNPNTDCPNSHKPPVMATPASSDAKRTSFINSVWQQNILSTPKIPPNPPHFSWSFRQTNQPISSFTDSHESREACVQTSTTVLTSCERPE